MKLDMNKLMRDIQKMQEEMQQKMAAVEQELARETVVGSGGGLVEVEMNGHRELTRVTIKPEALEEAAEGIENLEDLVYAAVNSALAQAKELYERKMQGVSGGMDLGGLAGMIPPGAL